MYIKLVSCAAFIVFFLSGCASVSSSSVPHVSESKRVSGQIYMTTATVPESVGYRVIGHVKANDRQGYGSVQSLYPLLAEEARKVGANAVINVKGGRTVAAFSWAAPFVGGIAIEIDDVNKLKAYGAKVE
ncbi:hypothetical protein [Neptunomonas antarctica]|uniref:Heavy-metal-binding n=1 Tax=Neptunomonas antarctica TaxID=619304 RepID=A0A1N7MXI5_9GAMM|nr:hypothetical protein [Neptunomonas antarctica]SIS90728.1 hypothetical protein SAMN05421760_10790 [Neptunomonas antarctica]